jgi:cytochrome c556
MNRKWIGFAAAAALVAASSLASGLSRAQDQEKHKEQETPLGRIMEKVQKHNIAITKATRNVAAFKKNQKEVEKSSAELVKLAKQGKQFKEAYLKNAKDESNPQQKWDEIMDAFAKTSLDLAVVAAKNGATQKEAKDLFQTVKKTCSDCHTVFRVEKDF